MTINLTLLLMQSNCTRAGISAISKRILSEFIRGFQDNLFIVTMLFKLFSLIEWIGVISVPDMDPHERNFIKSRLQ